MILIDKMTEEQKNRYREFLNFYSKDLTKIFGEMFSKKRAYTIAGILEEMGVLRGQMQVMGLGFEHEYHVNDLDEKGRLLEVEAQKNRSVMIINSESDMAQRLKLHFEVVDL